MEKFIVTYDERDILLFNKTKEIKKKTIKKIIEKINFNKHSFIEFCLLNLILFEKDIFENQGYIEEYIKKSGQVYRHWRGAFTNLQKNEKELCDSIFKNVGKFICENFDKEEIRKFIYHSTFFKCIAVDYAYSVGKNALAEKIIYLGYDRYFELETFYLMKKYNEKLFYKEIKNVKRICLKRIIYDENRMVYEFSPKYLYGNEFTKEFFYLAKKTKKEIEKTVDDPRKNEERIVPDWAK